MRLIDYLGKSVELNILRKFLSNPNKWFRQTDFGAGVMFNRKKVGIEKFKGSGLIISKISGKVREVYKLNKENKIVKMLMEKL